MLWTRIHADCRGFREQSALIRVHPRPNIWLRAARNVGGQRVEIHLARAVPPVRTNGADAGCAKKLDRKSRCNGVSTLIRRILPQCQRPLPIISYLSAAPRNLPKPPLYVLDTHVLPNVFISGVLQNRAHQLNTRVGAAFGQNAPDIVFAEIGIPDEARALLFFSWLDRLRRSHSNYGSRFMHHILSRLLRGRGLRGRGRARPRP